MKLWPLFIGFAWYRRSMTCRIIVPDRPEPEHRAAILVPLGAFNAQSGYPVDTATVAVLLDEGGRTVGGLWGQTSFGWLFVEYLAVPESMRGQDLGSALMEEAERIARDRGCGGVWLTTFSFQARAFYEKRGFEVFGELDQSPGENVRLLMRKRL